VIRLSGALLSVAVGVVATYAVVVEVGLSVLVVVSVSGRQLLVLGMLSHLLVVT
jgi:hypothetical protein